MNYYKINEGEVTELTLAKAIEFSAVCNWTDEVLIVTSSEDRALFLCELYDLGMIQQKNIFVPDCYGEVIVAIKEHE